jgi:hypothetical protein
LGLVGVEPCDAALLERGSLPGVHGIGDIRILPFGGWLMVDGAHRRIRFPVR